jgi:hypothetical protein
VVEPAADTKGALAHIWVLKSGAKLAAREAAQAAAVALWAEPGAARGGRLGQAQAGGVERSQAGPAADDEACATKTGPR